MKPECKVKNLNLEATHAMVLDVAGVLYDTPRETSMITRFIHYAL
jgi:hypothetical protein